MAKKTKIVWYARAEGIKRMGPFNTQVEAFAAIMGHDGFPVDNAFVWCENGKA